MKKTKKKWPEIWLEIAEAYWTPRKERTKRQKRLARRGLCNALSSGFDIKNSVDLVCDCFRPEGPYWWWNYGIKSDIFRARFAEHMAGIPHDDFEKFINGELI